MGLADILLTLVFLLVVVKVIASGIITFLIDLKCFDRIIRYKYMGGSCWGMESCGEENCCLKRHCYLYKNAVTPEVEAELDHLIEERRRELEAKGES